MKQLIIEAFDLKKKGYYKQAIELFYKMLAKEGDNVELLSELGNLYFLLNNYDRAINYTNKALEIDNNHSPSLITLRKINTIKKDYETASKIANKIYILTQAQEDLYEFIKILNIRKKYNEATGFVDFINSVNVAVEIAKAYYHLKKYDNAVEILQNIENNVDTTIHLDLLCKIFFETNQEDKAKEVLNKLKDKKTNDSEVLNYMGLSKLNDMELDSAIGYFTEAIKLDPQNDKYNYNLGQAYFLKGWLDEAKNHFLKAICITPTNQNYQYSLGYVLYKEGDFKNALTHLNNDLLEAKVLKMLIKYQSGDLVTAKTELEKLNQTNPNNETILFALSKIYFNLDLYNLALDMISKAIEINPNNFDYLSMKINIILGIENYENCKPIIEEILEKYPNYYYAHTLYAEYLYKTKDFDKLFNVAQDLIEMDLNHYEGYYYNALALLEKNDINFAIESLKKAITLDVNNASLYVKMGEIYQTLGQYENAFEYIKEASDIDKSAKNQELYREIANLIRKNKGM